MQKRLDLQFSRPDIKELRKRLGINASYVVGEWYAGKTLNGNMVDLDDAGHTLVNNNNCNIIDTSLAINNNNLLQGFGYNGTTQSHSVASGSWLNMINSDFSILMLVKMDADATGQRCLLGRGNNYNDQLMEIFPASSLGTIIKPSNRASFGMAYDSDRQKIVIFGGIGASSTYNNETWEYSYATNTWTKIAVAGGTAPTARANFSMCYDVARGKIVLFGGFNVSYNQETWTYDVATSTWLQKSPANKPTARGAFSMVYDSVRQTVILFGGNTGTANGETWEWNGTNWTNRSPSGSPPSARYSYAMAYDSVRQRTVLFGGFTGSYQQDTYEYNSSTNAWALLNPATKPAVRAQTACAYNPITQKTVVFAGTSTGSSALYNIYEWNGSNWSLAYNYAGSFNPRMNLAAVYDASMQKIVTFGGQVSSTYYGEMYSFDTVADGIRISVWPNCGYVVANVAQLGTVGPAVNICDGQWHWIHLLSGSGSIQLSVDGVTGTTSTGSNTNDIAAELQIGHAKTYWKGGISYILLLKTARLSAVQVDKIKDYFRGITPGAVSARLVNEYNVAPTFSRTGSAYTEQLGGTRTFKTPANWPALENGKGITLFDGYTQLARHTQHIDYSEWNTRTPYIGSTSALGPTDARCWARVASDADGSNLIAADNAGYIWISTDSGANWAKQTVLGMENWTGVASDDNGSVLLVVSGTVYQSGPRGYIYYSTDSGATWTRGNSGGFTYHSCCALDSDGSFMLVGIMNGSLLYSTNSGATWTSVTPGGAAKLWTSVACDADGSHLIAGEHGGYVWTSINSIPGTWTNKTNSLGTKEITGVCTNDVGTKLAFCAGTGSAGQIYTSTDSGGIWTSRTVSGVVSYKSQWGSITCSTDGVKLAICALVNSGGVWTSTDSGANWTERTAAGESSWSCIASDSDGSNLIVCAGNTSIITSGQRRFGYLLTSADSGVNWTTRTVPATDFGMFNNLGYCGCNSDGTVLVTNTSGGYTYISRDSGVTWKILRQFGAGNSYEVKFSANDQVIGVVRVTVTMSCIYLSFDAGITWRTCIPTSGKSWQSIAFNSDGSFMAAVPSSGYVYTSTDYGISWTEQIGSGSRGWRFIVCSDDGTKLAALLTGSANIWTSPNSGVTWVERTNSGSRSWNAISCDSTGDKLVAAVNSGYIYTSTDQGLNWTQRAGSGAWFALTMSSDGNTMYAGRAMSTFWKSINAGVDWTEVTSIGPRWFYSAGGRNGTNVVAFCGEAGYVWRSTDSGTTWTQLAMFSSAGIRPSWNTICADSTLTNIIIGGMGTYLYKTSDSGSTWTTMTGAGCRVWGSIARDSDGSHIVACGYGLGNKLWVSTNSGTSWTARSVDTVSWIAVCCDNDGSVMAAVGSSVSAFYLSTDSGTTWNTVTSLGTKSWQGIACNSDGSVIVGCVAGAGSVWVSTNSGVDWADRSPVASVAYSKVVVSADGNTIIVLGNATTYKSTNRGATWTQLVNGPTASGYLFADSTLTNITNYPYEISRDGGTSWEYYVMPTDSTGVGVINFNDCSSVFCASLHMAAVGIASIPSPELTSSPATFEAPDGTLTYTKIVASANNVEHPLYNQHFLTSATNYIFEIDVREGSAPWFYIALPQLSNVFAYFNIGGIYTGTVGGSARAYIQKVGDRVRCSLAFTALTTQSYYVKMCPAMVDNNTVFTGDGTTASAYLWEGSLRAGYYPAMPQTRVVATSVRSADTLTYPSRLIYSSYKIGTLYSVKKLIIECRIKCLYTSNLDQGTAYRPFIEIGGNSGTASNQRNRLWMGTYLNQAQVSFYNDANDAAERKISLGSITNWNSWKIYRTTYNFTDLSLSSFTVDGVAGTLSNMSGGHNFDMTNCLIRLGNNYQAQILSSYLIDYVKIWTE